MRRSVEVVGFVIDDIHPRVDIVVKVEEIFNKKSIMRCNTQILLQEGIQ